MVVFGLYGINKSTSHNAIQTRPSILKNNEVDVLDELMDLNNKYSNVNGNKDLDTSSFNLNEIMNRVSTRNNNECINYKVALINSLYSQVEHLRGESLRKDRIIEHFMNNNIISPIKPGAKRNNYSSSVDSISEISNPQENPFFNDYCRANDSVNKSNTRSLYSDISTSPLSTTAADVSITTNTCFEDYDRQLANYRYKHHLNTIENKRKANYDPETTNVQFMQNESKKIKVALERIKSNIKNTDVKNEGKPSNHYDDIEIIHEINTNLGEKRDALHVYNGKTDNRILWKKGTTLIVGDSMLNGLDESRLRNCKVRVYPGSSIEDMHYNIIPLLRKRPSTVILHIGTNNTTRDNSHQIIEKLANLKQLIISQIPDVRLIISSLIRRYDDDKAQLTSEVTNTMLHSVSDDIINNDNININHLGKRGHHMTPYGTGRLAMNIIKVLKSL